MVKEVLITTYNRRKYFEQTLENILWAFNGELNLYVVDGGSADGTIDIIKADKRIKKAAIFSGNPGADHLKSYGASNFVKEDSFILSSDDLLYSWSWNKVLEDAFKKINSSKMEVPYLCPQMDYMLKMELDWEKHKELPLYFITCPQPCGALIHTETIKNLGYFPRQYGKSGSGDYSLGKRMTKAGLKGAYLRTLVCLHLGGKKREDFQEYSAQYDVDKEETHQQAKWDNLPDIPIAEPVEVIIR